MSRSLDMVSALRDGWMHVLLVLGAFLVTTLASYFYVSSLMRRQIDLHSRSELMVYQGSLRLLIQANEDALGHATSVMSMAIERGASAEERLRILRELTTVFSGQKDIGNVFRSVYGFLDGSFMDGSGLVPGTFFNSKTAPWFRGALLTKGFHHTEPAIDPRIGRAVATISTVVYDRRRESHGVLAVDYLIAPIVDQVASLKVGDSGFGLLTDNSWNILAYPDPEFVGKPLSMAPGFSSIAGTLASAPPGGVHIERFDIRGERHIGFFTEMENGWHLGVAAPEAFYYGEAKAMLPAILGINLTLAAILSVILLRLNVAKNRSEEESRLKSSFLARMSHEIRTPMNAILGLSELAERNYGSREALGYIADIRKAGGSLLGIINDILDLSRIESGKFRIAFERFHPGRLVDDVLAVAGVRAREKGLELIADIDPTIPSGLVGDSLNIQQVLLNLLSNAVKYTEKGRVKLTVRWDRLDLKGVLLAFTVEDTGQGIREEDLPSLFGDFVRLEDWRRGDHIEGTGLGLSIARSICRMMEGDVTVESTWGRGSAFTATFRQEAWDFAPIGESHGAGAPAPGPAGAYRAVFRAPGCKILVVDDIRTNLTVAKGLLKQYGVSATACTGGEEALEAARETRFDILFIDQMMPGLDGCATMKLMREISPHYRSAPIIAFTANAIAGTREALLSLGFSDYISKPVDVRELAAILDRWVPEGLRLPPETAGEEHPAPPNPAAAAAPPPGDRTPPPRGAGAAVPAWGAGVPSGAAGAGGGARIPPDAGPAASGDAASRLPGELRSLDGLPGYDPATGLERCGGSPHHDLRVLGVFLEDIADYLQYADSREGGDLSGRLGLLAARVHALKSGLGGIGARALAAEAAFLEQAARQGDAGPFGNGRLEAFDVALVGLRDHIARATAPSPSGGGGVSPEDLAALKEAISSGRVGDADRLVDRLSASTGGATKEILDNVSDLILVSDFAEAARLIDELAGAGEDGPGGAGGRE
ncbi:MAG: response regulator [Deltaproteobacteria bacterium]|jgi:signal transduction histidine kinase/CheY-like chemotaxis protein/HPt (histidine-containing phosphotransfer) domain-containing protein|nr:response regulator [Deltaproteobacteria bacterium]